MNLIQPAGLPAPASRPPAPAAPAEARPANPAGIPDRGVPAGRGGFSVVVVRGRADLEAHAPGWDDLARNAVEPNPFYEPWNVLPALDSFGDERPFFVFVYGRPPGLPAGKPLACGFFPLVRRRPSRLAPFHVVESWRHRYCFLTAPLVRAGCGELVLDTFFDWLGADPDGGAVWKLEVAPAEGPFAQQLTRACNARLRPTFVQNAYARASFEVPADLDAYLAAALSGRQRRDLRRREKLLAGRGKLETRVLAPGDDPGPWLDDFLRLEALGWKGREGTALAQDEPGARYFRAMAAGAFAQGRLHLLGLFLDGRAVALKCNLLAPPGSFAFKIAFDESLSACSPGVLLELASMEHLCAARPVRWMDSCTARPDHPMIDRLWAERRAVHALLVAAGRAPGDLAVSLLPLGRWLKRKLRRPRPAAPAAPAEGKEEETTP